MLFVNSCCCTCLSTENLHNIQNKDAENVMLLDKLLYCLTEKDSIFECAPLLICDKCSKLLQELYSFKKIGMKNLDMFRNCLKQLIRNPFSNLRLETYDKQTNAGPGPSTEIPRQEIPVQIIQNTANLEIGAIIKLEQLEDSADYTEYIEVDQPENIRNEGESSIQIQNVESLRRKYKKRVAKDNSMNYSENSVETEKIKRKCKFPQKTVCHPCGKRFVRYDYYINHILSCSKSDISTKNSVLNWISKQTRSGDLKINPTTLNLLKNYSYKIKNNSGVKFDCQNIISETKTKNVRPVMKKVFKGKPKKKDKFQRTVCSLCNKPIATRFFKRHFIRCSAISKKNETIDELAVSPNIEANKTNMVATVNIEPLPFDNI